MTVQLVIQPGFSDTQRTRAAQLYYTAFRQKLQPIFRDEQRAITVLRESINSTHAITAQLGDDLAGIAGFKDSKASFVDIKPRTMTSVFGFIEG